MEAVKIIITRKKLPEHAYDNEQDPPPLDRFSAHNLFGGEWVFNNKAGKARGSGGEPSRPL